MPAIWAGASRTRSTRAESDLRDNLTYGLTDDHALGVTPNPTGAWVAQQPRNFLMDLGDRATQFTVLIKDRDSKFTSVFDVVFASEAIRILRTPVRAPRANAIAERWIATVRRELLDRILIINRHHLIAVLTSTWRTSTTTARTAPSTKQHH